MFNHYMSIHSIKSDIRRILCIRTDRIGEFLLTIPAIEQLKRTFPLARITLLAQTSNITLMHSTPCIDAWMEYERMPKTPWGLAAVLKKEKFDLAVAFHPHKLFHQALFLAGIPHRAGYAHKWGFLLNIPGQETELFRHAHEVERNLLLLNPRHATDKIPAPRLPWNERNNLYHILEEHGVRSLAPFVIIHPFTSNPQKEVPFRFWEKVIDRVIGNGQTALLIGQEHEYQNSLFRNIKKPGMVSLAGRLELRATANLIQHFCSYYIGLDSGPFHMASLAGVPLSVIFRFPETVRRWGPFFNRNSAQVLIYENKTEDFLVRKISLP